MIKKIFPTRLAQQQELDVTVKESYQIRKIIDEGGMMYNMNNFFLHSKVNISEKGDPYVLFKIVIVVDCSSNNYME